MQTLEAIHGRKSIRAFLPTPVPKDVLVQILEAARWAPSAVNRQQWRVTVAGGEACRALAGRLAERALQGRPEAPEPTDTGRQGDSLVADLTRIAERQGQSLWDFVVLGSHRFFGAPTIVVLSAPGRRGGDAVPFVTTMLLAAHDLGVGSCWLGYPLRYSELIREALGIPEEEAIGALVALGYPDPDSPATAYRSPRHELEMFVRWVGLD